MIHINPWSASVGLMRHAGQILTTGAPLVLYGPFVCADVPLADSNVSFDADLKARDPRWGVRDLDEVCQLAAEHGFEREAVIEMPANNLSLVMRRR